MDVLSAIWAIVSFALSVVWTVAWFLLRDLLSTVLWLLVAVWLVLGVRYRSFGAGTLALLRYGRFGLRLAWRSIRGGARPSMSSPSPIAQDIAERRASRRRIPIGYMAVSSQLNILLIAGVWFLIAR